MTFRGKNSKHKRKPAVALARRCGRRKMRSGSQCAAQHQVLPVASGRTDGRPGPVTEASLVIRVWVEPDNPKPFRARITTDRAGGKSGIRYAADREEVIAVVRQWLAALPDAKP